MRFACHIEFNPNLLLLVSIGLRAFHHQGPGAPCTFAASTSARYRDGALATCLGFLRASEFTSLFQSQFKANITLRLELRSCSMGESECPRSNGEAKILKPTSDFSTIRHRSNTLGKRMLLLSGVRHKLIGQCNSMAFRMSFDMGLHEVNAFVYFVLAPIYSFLRRSPKSTSLARMWFGQGFSFGASSLP